jgi:hypothetical protein
MIDFLHILKNVREKVSGRAITPVIETIKPTGNVPSHSYDGGRIGKPQRTWPVVINYNTISVTRCNGLI